MGALCEDHNGCRWSGGKIAFVVFVKTGKKCYSFLGKG